MFERVLDIRIHDFLIVAEHDCGMRFNETSRRDDGLKCGCDIITCVGNMVSTIVY